jgi:hypothetical protein
MNQAHLQVFFSSFLVTRYSDHSCIAVFLYYVQTGAILVGPARHWMSWMQVYNLDPTVLFPQDADSATCLAAFTQEGVVILPFLFPAGAFLALFTVLGLHKLAARLQPARFGFDWARYRRTLLALSVSSYTQIASCVFAVLRPPVKVGDQCLMRANPAIECSSSTFTGLLVVAILMLVVILIAGPLLLGRFLRRNRANLNSTAFLSRWAILYEPFTEEAFYWQTLLLCRRSARCSAFPCFLSPNSAP